MFCYARIKPVKNYFSQDVGEKYWLVVGKRNKDRVVTTSGLMRLQYARERRVSNRDDSILLSFSKLNFQCLFFCNPSQSMGSLVVGVPCVWDCKK